jgi:hypothetical protein
MKIKDYTVSTPTAGSKILGTSATGVTENYSILDMNISVPESNYKVFTGLLTQNGVDDVSMIDIGSLTIGVTYNISSIGGNSDFTNVGAPNNNLGTSFIATGTTPNSWGGSELTFNLGAPVVRILVNTIGNIWFTYDGIGYYGVRSNGLFTDYKTTVSINLMGDDASTEAKCIAYIDGSNYNGISTGLPGGPSDSTLSWLTPIEIRVYS